jgi:hypothetical protein
MRAWTGGSRDRGGGRASSPPRSSRSGRPSGLRQQTLGSSDRSNADRSALAATTTASLLAGGRTAGCEPIQIVQHRATFDMAGVGWIAASDDRPDPLPPPTTRHPPPLSVISVVSQPDDRASRIADPPPPRSAASIAPVHRPPIRPHRPPAAGTGRIARRAREAMDLGSPIPVESGRKSRTRRRAYRFGTHVTITRRIRGARTEPRGPMIPRGVSRKS